MQLLTHTVLSNHSHAVVRVPQGGYRFQTPCSAALASVTLARETFPGPKLWNRCSEKRSHHHDVRYDVFISHASEDKDEFVRPLANELKRLGLVVWYDESSLSLGDSLLQKIDEGLANCDYGVVVISKSFVEKKRPTAELDGLFSREAKGRKRILPIWHRMTATDVGNFSPILAGKLAACTSEGVQNVAAKINAVVRPSVDAAISGYRSAGTQPESARETIEPVTAKPWGQAVTR